MSMVGAKFSDPIRMQAEPVAVDLAVVAGVEAVEHLEDALALPDGDPRPLIHDLHPHPIPLRRRFDAHITLRRILQRVVEQVEEHAGHSARIGAYGE